MMSSVMGHEARELIRTEFLDTDRQWTLHLEPKLCLAITATPPKRIPCSRLAAREKLAFQVKHVLWRSEVTSVLSKHAPLGPHSIGLACGGRPPLRAEIVFGYNGNAA